MNYRLFGYLVSCCLLIGLDRITKQIALVSFAMPYPITNWLTLELVFNRGISWGILHGYSEYLGSIITLLVTVILCILVWYVFYRYRSGISIYAELMVLAGAASNLWDRFMYPGVIDFIHLHVCELHWAIFNIADCAITVGVLAMLIQQYLEGGSRDVL